jgi:hypothetical protein
MNDCIIRGAWIYDHPGLLRSSYRDHNSPRSLGVVSFRLVLPHRTFTIHGGDYFSLRPTSSLRTDARTGRLSKFLGFRIATPASIAPPSQQPKIISLISIAVCDDGSVSIHIGRQQGL